MRNTDKSPLQKNCRHKTTNYSFAFSAHKSYYCSYFVYTYAGYFLWIDCNLAEAGLKTTPCSECALNALAIDNLLEYARLYLEGGMQIWVDTEDSLELY